MRQRAFTAFVCAAAIAQAALAQSNIDPNNAFSWGENIGWMNWLNDPNKGVFVANDHLHGFIWCENVGWINVGGGGPYANDPNDSSTFGVNLDPNTGELSGMAWGENVGWVNFGGGALATPPNPARLDTGCRFRGYAWGENVGWVNLDDPNQFVAILLDGDADGNGIVDLDDLTIQLQNFGAAGVGRSQGDFDGDGDVDLDDLTRLLQNFGAVCP